jgi:hypothetical protein
VEGLAAYFDLATFAGFALILFLLQQVTRFAAMASIYRTVNTTSKSAQAENE